MPKRILSGVVTSDKNEQTITVQVGRSTTHPLFHKVIRSSKKYRAHDENNTYKVGDAVRIIECAPRSKTKRWEVLEDAAASAE
ncbi:30S ribosomal protein S17 [Pontivivens nitratireducens]|jgi:small subunit ribosomal protein S17|uniref:Small ribosomal subunit protein uS17 n=1 Tax=Pontivivens nitratireducens TaxID=2758038 RepID=A0A6G7VJF4_9RHOB|nr:30S ribosomal protein S17 [Pontibrevibacter nitratireducens]QIK40134.1 30S ribosomal protein S17 [Pontibrevibacter nitratireducens]